MQALLDQPLCEDVGLAVVLLGEPVPLTLVVDISASVWEIDIPIIMKYLLWFGPVDISISIHVRHVDAALKQIVFL